MDNIYLGVRVIFPLLIFMAVGISFRELKWFNEKTFLELNKVVFRVFMPIMLFLNANMESIGDVFSRQNIQVLLIAVACVLVTIVVISIMYCKKETDKKRKAVLLQAAFRSNFLLYGVTVHMTIYGEGNSSTVTVLVVAIVPLYNIISAILLRSATVSKMSIGSAIKTALTNPFVVAVILGLLFNLSGASIPNPIYAPLNQLGRVGVPLAFIVLGGSFGFRRLKEEWKVLMQISAVRLLLVPLLALAIACGFDISGPPLTALIVLSAAPVAVASYTMAKEEQVAPELAGDLVAITTFLSLVTVSGWVTLLGFWELL